MQNSCVKSSIPASASYDLFQAVEWGVMQELPDTASVQLTLQGTN